MRYDVIVIGGSFAGLSAAMQLARARRTVCVIDAGRPRNRFAAASHGFFGQDGTPPYQMISDARAKVAAYPTVSFVDQEAVDARREAEGFAVALASGEQLHASKLVLAFGLVDELPAIPGLKERWGITALHCPYCHGFEFAGRPLGVLSVGPMSSHQALLISDWGPTTFFLNGGSQPDMATLGNLANRNVNVEPAPVATLEGSGTALTGVRLADGRVAEIAALYLGSRTSMASPIAGRLGCAFNDGPFGPFIKTDGMAGTTVPGVFAAGDIARRAHNATWASADGVTAGAAAHRALVFGPLAAA